MYLSIGETALVIGVAVSTLRRWEKEGRFAPCFRTKGGHRRYCLAEIRREFHDDANAQESRTTLAYARVSSFSQKGDLERQITRLEDFCNSRGYSFTTISDLGSGLNYGKKGLNKLFHQICLGQVERLILTNRDRLLRFGTPLLFKICSYFNTDVIILDDVSTKTFEEELVADVIELMTVFTSRVYGKRSHKYAKTSKKVA